ncbi:glycosyltransferase family 2 protein [Gillisia sp. CAL575]|uniref:glycosyltransferase family 2 protein n=1 Tax=Gillisia sp. CAL575 TaxID=985255 RepID=UPI0003A80CEB|nr:glycosyltransferase family 2 protein [Gillisia sp. CAL575]
MMLAIVIPYFKLEFFEECLSSLAAQTNKNFKVYIGNDASPDNPKPLLENFNNRFVFEYKEFSENLGNTSLVSQWHRCIEMVADENWILILGDDDVLGKNVVESFYKNLEEVEGKCIQVIRYSSQVIDANSKNISGVHKHPEIESSQEFLKRKLKGSTRSSLSEYCFKKNSILEIKFKEFPLAWYSDLLAVLEVSNFQRIFSINQAIVYFRLSGNNITSRTDNLTSKNNATFDFYYYILEKYDFRLDPELNNLLLDHLEKTFLDNKKRMFRWIVFTRFYFKNKYFKRYINFIGKCGIYIS